MCLGYERGGVQGACGGAGHQAAGEAQEAVRQEREILVRDPLTALQLPQGQSRGEQWHHSFRLFNTVEYFLCRNYFVDSCHIIWDKVSAAEPVLC